MRPWPTTPSHANTFTYDSAGNRLTAKKDGVTTTFSYDLADQLTTSVVGTTTTTYTYDSAGNQTLQVVAPNTRTTYTWNDDNRQTRVQATGVDLTAKYRYDGLRYEKAASGTTTRFLFDGQNYLLETNTSGIVQAAYTGEPRTYGKVISRRASSATRYYHFDALGSTRIITNSSQSSTDAYMYDAWGVPVVALGSTTNPFRWVGGVGYYYDTETGLYYVRTRVYSAATARWMSVDRIRRERRKRPFQYCSNQPLRLIDPHGLAPNQEFASQPLAGEYQFANCECVGGWYTLNIRAFRWTYVPFPTSLMRVREEIRRAQNIWNQCCIRINVSGIEDIAVGFDRGDNDNFSGFDTDEDYLTGDVELLPHGNPNWVNVFFVGQNKTPVFDKDDNNWYLGVDNTSGTSYPYYGNPAHGTLQNLTPAVLIFHYGVDNSYATLAHELGHILGLLHDSPGTSQEERTLMYWANTGSTTELSRLTRHQCLGARSSPLLRRP